MPFKVLAINVIEELIEFHDVRLVLGPFGSEKFKYFAVEHVHKIRHLILSGWYCVDRIKDKGINIDSLDLILGIIK